MAFRLDELSTMLVSASHDAKKPETYESYRRSHSEGRNGREPGGVLVLFDDQSNIKIKAAGPSTIPPGGTSQIRACGQGRVQKSILKTVRARHSA